MKPKAKIIILTSILALAIFYIGWQFNLKQKYEEHIKIEELFTPISISEATSQQLDEINQIKENWTVIYDNKTDINNSLDVTGYPRTIAGLLAMWEHRSAPYSFTNQDQNKQNILIKTVQNLTMERGEWVTSEKLLFRFMNGAASAYLETPQGVVQIVYQNKKAKKAQ